MDPSVIAKMNQTQPQPHQEPQPTTDIRTWLEESLKFSKEESNEIGKLLEDQKYTLLSHLLEIDLTDDMLKGYGVIAGRDRARILKGIKERVSSNQENRPKWASSAYLLSPDLKHLIEGDFETWADAFIELIRKKGVSLVTIDEVQHDMYFIDRLVCHYSAKTERPFKLVILGTPAQGLMKLEMGANIVSRSAFVNVPPFNVVEVYSLFKKKYLKVEPNLFLDCWTLLDGNPSSYMEYLMKGIPEDFLKRQAELVNYLLKSGTASFLPHPDLLEVVGKASVPSSQWTTEQNERLQKLVERDVLVRKIPFSDYFGNRGKKKIHIGFTSYHPVTAVDANSKKNQLKTMNAIGNFMKSHRGYALEDAFRSYYLWAIDNTPNIVVPGLNSSTLSGWEVVDYVSFHGINSDADMMLEAIDKNNRELILFYIKTEAEALGNEEGIERFLSAFDIPALNNYRVNLVLGYLVGVFDESFLNTWSLHCTKHQSRFVPPSSAICLMDLLEKTNCLIVDGLVSRPYLKTDLENNFASKDIVRLQGLRQVGKTTFIQQYMKNSDKKCSYYIL